MVSLGAFVVFFFRFQDLSEGEENQKTVIGDVLSEHGHPQTGHHSSCRGGVGGGGINRRIPA